MKPATTNISAKARALAWACILLACLASLANALKSGYRFDTSIMALLPGETDTSLLEGSRKQLSAQFSNRLLFLVGGNSERLTPEEISEFANRFQQALVANDPDKLIGFAEEVRDLQELAAPYHAYRYKLLSRDDRRALQNDDIEPFIKSAQQQLLSPAAAPRVASVIDDPINLFQQFVIEQLDVARGNIQIDTHGPFIESANRHYRLIPATLQGNAFDMGLQTSVLNSIDRARLSISHPDVELLHSGLIFHAAAGANQAKTEISTIGLGSLAGIIIILGLHFRSPTPLLMAATSIAAGVVFALAISMQVFDRLHMITLAFGAGLVGVAIDYTLHYCCARRALGADSLAHILPGIALGLLSSLLAYGAIALTPFPGLQQMAFFSACGLVGAWLTVACFYGRIPLPAERKPSRIAQLPAWLIARRPNSRNLLAAATLTILAGVGALEFSDNVRNLQSSPAELIEQEKVIQSLLSPPSNSQYFLIEGADAEAILTREEQLRRLLEPLIADGRLTGYRAISQAIPSLTTQAANYQLAGEAFYQQRDAIERLTTPLGLPTTIATELAQRYHAQADQWLTFAEWQSNHRTQSENLWLTKGETSAAILPLIPGSTMPNYNELVRIATTLPGVNYVDSVRTISDTLGDYRQSVSRWILVAYVLVTLLLLLRYGASALRISAPPLLATLLTLAMLSLAGQEISLFNMLASLLILGIGLDIGIFLTESSHKAHAWEATILSTLTTLLAFGLLSLSQTPVLHQFGITVLPGIAITWLLAMQFSPAPTDSNSPNPEGIS